MNATALAGGNTGGGRQLLHGSFTVLINLLQLPRGVAQFLALQVCVTVDAWHMQNYTSV